MCHFMNYSDTQIDSKITPFIKILPAHEIKTIHELEEKFWTCNKVIECMHSDLLTHYLALQSFHDSER